jgi:hypothetical protein
MPFLDAKALEIDPEGMAFLRSILKPETAEVRPAPSLPVPGLPSPATAAPEERAAPRGPDAPTARVRSVRRSGELSRTGSGQARKRSVQARSA